MTLVIYPYRRALIISPSIKEWGRDGKFRTFVLYVLLLVIVESLVSSIVSHFTWYLLGLWFTDALCLVQPAVPLKFRWLGQLRGACFVNKVVRCSPVLLLF